MSVTYKLIKYRIREFKEDIYGNVCDLSVVVWYDDPDGGNEVSRRRGYVSMDRLRESLVLLLSEHSSGAIE